MRVSAVVGPDGQIKREVDFEGALLPDGRSIETILNENENLKEQVEILNKEIRESASILTVIRNRKIRVVIEIILILSTILGFIVLFL